MLFISWNVNGIRSCLKKDFNSFFKITNADFLCIQEVKAFEDQVLFPLLDEYQVYWHAAERPGYSGTAVFTKHVPLAVTYDMEGFVGEGRIICLEYKNFFLLNVYTPNSGRELSRLAYRMSWEDAFRAYICKLNEQKPVILCGDLNVAHNEIDLKNPKSNRQHAGFTDIEREKFTKLLDSGFVDSFRYLYPNKTDAYTWWSYIGQARERNAGWRIDYFLVSNRLKGLMKDAIIFSEVLGSDHCPTGLYLNMEPT